MTSQTAPDAIRPFPQDNSRDSLDVLILYDDLSAGRNAMGVLRQLGNKLHQDPQLQPVLCRFDLLQDSGWRAKTEAEAREADLLIIASSGCQPVPDRILEWLRSSFLAKREKPLAVAALFGASPTRGRQTANSFESPAVQLVRSAVEAAGFDFFAPSSSGDSRLDLA